jgi:hypothetical protein
VLDPTSLVSVTTVIVFVPPAVTVVGSVTVAPPIVAVVVIEAREATKAADNIPTRIMAMTPIAKMLLK